MKNTNPRPAQAQPAFSLIELLTVIAIIAMMAAFTGPAINSLGQSTSMNTALQQMLGELDAARQAAVARNRTVEVRFYYLPGANESSSSTPRAFRAMQTFLVGDGATNALTRVTYLPQSVEISDYSADSTLTDSSLNPRQSPGTDWPSLPGYNKNYQAAVFRFSPRGSLGPELDMTKQWYFSMFSVKGSQRDTNNYGTIQIDPMNGRAALYRP